MLSTGKGGSRGQQALDLQPAKPQQAQAEKFEVGALSVLRCFLRCMCACGFLCVSAHGCVWARATLHRAVTCVCVRVHAHMLTHEYLLDCTLGPTHVQTHQHMHTTHIGIQAAAQGPTAARFRKSKKTRCRKSQAVFCYGPPSPPTHTNTHTHKHARTSTHKHTHTHKHTRT